MPRSSFPRGLVQPEGGYRFSMDPLLLAAFAKAGKDAAVLDLGAGCGVAGLALLLRADDPGTRLAGYEIDPAMIEAAGENARLLECADRVRVIAGDVRRIREHPDIGPEAFDLVLCNPPYRDPGSGRVPPAKGRLRARFETGGGLADFIGAAAYALRNRGRFAMVIVAERLAAVMAACGEKRLEPKRLVFVHSRIGEPARLVLVECVKNGAPGLIVEPPLVLYRGEGRDSVLTPEALAFCPHLACNPGPGRKTA